MKRKNAFKIALTLSLTLGLVTLLHKNAYAADAVVDILENDRFNGVVSTVNKIGRVVDTYFMSFISFVSFFIISAACLRNVLAGAYCVYPKFWDKVDEAHKEKGISQVSISSIKTFFTGGGVQGATVGSVGSFLLSFLPNLKVLTDFDNENDVDFKRYFMKAIPQAIIAVFIGVFIYNGYYRDVMVKTSQFGSEIVVNALNSVDPAKTMEKLAGVSALPKTPIDNAKTGQEAIAKMMLQKSWAPILGEYPDISEKSVKKTNYNKLASLLVSKAQAFSAFPVESNKYSISATVEQTLIPTQDTDLADGKTHYRYLNIPISEIGLTTNEHKGDTMYLRLVLQIVNTIKDSSMSDSISDFKLTIKGAGQNQGGNTIFNLGSGQEIGFMSSAGNNWPIQIGNAKAKVENGKLVVQGTYTPSSGQAQSVTGFSIQDTSSNSVHTITQIVFTGGNGNATLEGTYNGKTIQATWGTDSISSKINAAKSSAQQGAGTSQQGQQGGNRPATQQGGNNNNGDDDDLSGY